MAVADVACRPCIYRFSTQPAADCSHVPDPSGDQAVRDRAQHFGGAYSGTGRRDQDFASNFWAHFLDGQGFSRGDRNSDLGVVMLTLSILLAGMNLHLAYLDQLGKIREGLLLTAMTVSLEGAINAMMDYVGSAGAGADALGPGIVARVVGVLGMIALSLQEKGETGRAGLFCLCCPFGRSQLSAVHWRGIII